MELHGDNQADGESVRPGSGHLFDAAHRDVRVADSYLHRPVNGDRIEPGSDAINADVHLPARYGAAGGTASSITPANGVGTVPLASVTANVQWIKVTSATQAPATVQVSLNPGLLSPGTYSGSVLVTGQGSPQASLEIPVVVTINSLVALTASPASLSFTYQIGQAAPAAQSFMVAAGNAALNFTATAPGNWVTVNPVHGVTPGTVMVTINPAGLAPARSAALST